MLNSNKVTYKIMKFLYLKLKYEYKLITLFSNELIFIALIELI